MSFYLLLFLILIFSILPHFIPFDKTSNFFPVNAPAAQIADSSGLGSESLFIFSLSLIDIGGYALRIDTLDGRCLRQSFTFDCLCLYLPCRFSIYFCYSPTKQTKLPVVWTPTISSSFSILSFSTFFPIQSRPSSF